MCAHAHIHVGPSLWNMCGGWRTARGVSLHLPPCWRQGLFRCCVYQVRWSTASGTSPLPSTSTVATILQIFTSAFGFTWILGIRIQVLLLM